MAEPTRRVDSQWTTDTLLELMNERDRRYEQARDYAQKAVEVAEQNAEKWRDSANEWRAAMVDRERNFLPKAMGYVMSGLSIGALILTLVDKLK